MNFLVDANLPPRLRDWLRQQGHQAVHVEEFHSLRLPDVQIWQRAAARLEIVATKDEDFHDRSLLFGKPPQVLFIAAGNCSNADLFAILGKSWLQIESELVGGARMVVVRKNRLEIFPP